MQGNINELSHKSDACCIICINNMFVVNLVWSWYEMTCCDITIFQCSVTGEKEPECDSFYWGETEISTSSPGNISHHHLHHHHHDHRHPPDHHPRHPLQRLGRERLLQVHSEAHDVSVPGDLSLKHRDDSLEISGGFNTFIIPVSSHLNVVKSINSDFFCSIF